MTAADRAEAARIADERAARALRLIVSHPDRNTTTLLDVANALEAAPREEAPDPLRDFVARQTDLPADMERTINEKMSSLYTTAAPYRMTDDEMREAVKGRTTPDGKPVRWVAWSDYSIGSCYAFHSEPEFRGDGSVAYGDTYQQDDMYDPARAGQTLWVGEGPDPRDQGVPDPRTQPQYNCPPGGLPQLAEEPRGCPMPGACSAVAPISTAGALSEGSDASDDRALGGVPAGSTPAPVSPAPAALPPLMVAGIPIAQSPMSYAWAHVREWERLCREERAARERERAELAAARTALFQAQEAAKDLVRQVDEARAIAERLADVLLIAFKSMPETLPWKAQP